MKNITLQLLCLFWLLPALVSAQELPEHTEEVKVTGAKPKTIIIDQPVDSVYAFLCRFPYLQLKAEKQTPHDIITLVTELQTFTDKDTYAEYVKEGKEFYNLYSFSIPAKWKLTLTAAQEGQTAIALQLLSYYLDTAGENYNYAKNYKKYRHIVSNNNLEGLIELHARQIFAAGPIAAVIFSREKGFDNHSYRYDHFIPGHTFKEKGIWNEAVPATNPQKPAEPALIIYAKDSGTLLSLNEKSLAVNWQQQIPFFPKEQNHNEFTVYDHVVYLPVNNGYLSAIDAVTGKLYWQFSPKAYTEERQSLFFGQKAPVFDSTVYINDNKLIYAVNRFTGRVIWSQQHGGYGLYNYSADDQYVYKSGILEMLQISKRDGEVHKIINSMRANTFYFPNLLLDNNILILCDGDTYAYDLKNDKIIWQKDFAYEHIAKSSDGKSIYLDILSAENAVISTDPVTGALLWKCPVPVKADEKAELLDFQLDKDELCLLVKINNNDDKKEVIYKITVVNAKGKIIRNHLLAGRPLSNLVISAQQIMVMTPNGFTYLNRKDGTVSDKKYDLKGLVPASDYSRNYIERVE